MPSTQSSLSTEKCNDIGPVNKQPSPALTMSTVTDPNLNGPGGRAMRLRGGCIVRHSSVIPIPINYTFSSNANATPVGAAVWSAAFEAEVCFCVIPQFQLLTRILLGRHPFSIFKLLLSSGPNFRTVICSFNAIEHWLWTSLPHWSMWNSILLKATILER